jgi:two-component system, LytTR family, sensor kinase
MFFLHYNRKMALSDKAKKILDTMFFNKDTLSFYKLNLIGWILLLAADSIIVSPGLVFSDFGIFLQNSFAWIVGFFITLYLRSFYKKFDYKENSISHLILLILIGSAITSLLLYFSSNAIYLISRVGPFYKKLNYFAFKNISSNMTRFFPLMTTWSLLYFGIKIWIDFTKEREKVIKAELFAQQAQLQMLRYQINPHFLFNSFSSLRALTRTAPKKAEEMISKLSEFYRYSLVSRNHEVSLLDEIEAITHYFEIEKIRFEENLVYEFHIDPVSEVYPIPSFLIHPIVDNAIKYGMKTSSMPLVIYINTEVKNGRLIIEVKNSGKWIAINDGSEYYSTGTGINNIKNRLEFAYPDKHSLDIYEKDGFVVIRIEIFKEMK